MPKKMAQTHFWNFPPPFPEFFAAFFLGIFEIFENFPYFFGPLKVPIEKSFRGGFNWKNSKFFTTDQLLSKLLGENVISAKIGVLRFLIFLTASPSSTPPDFGAKSTG